MKTIDVKKVLAPLVGEGNPHLKIDGDLTHRCDCKSAGAIPFKNDNVDLFNRLLDDAAVSRAAVSKSVDDLKYGKIVSTLTCASQIKSTINETLEMHAQAT